MFNKEVSDSYDAMFDINHDGKLNSVEYSEQLYYLNQDAERWGEYRSKKELNKIGEYIQAIGDCAGTLVEECRKIETAYNTVEKEWREGAKSEDDLNVLVSKELLKTEDVFCGLRDLLCEEAFCKQLSEIENQSNSITECMKNLQKNCVQGFEIWFNTLLDFYNGYMEIVACLTDVNGSYYSYTNKFLSSYDMCFENYQKFDLLANMQI